MPRILTDFPAMEPGSIGTYSIDFSPDLPPAVTLASVSWTLGLHAFLPGATIDPTPQARLIGAPWIAGTFAAQRIGGLFAGNDYLVIATATFSDGEVFVRWTVLPCRAPQ
jgi:hypothetical protein